MQEITSLQNNIVKEIFKLRQKKYRDDIILLEGRKSTEGAIEAGMKIEYVLTRDKELYDKYEGDKTYFVTEAILKKLSTTETPPEIIMTAKRPVYGFEKFKNFKKIVLLDGLKDAGNLGTVIRTSVAFGIDGIMLYGNHTDAFSTKTIRSSVGTVFKIPIIKIADKELFEFKKTHKLVATVVNSDKYPESFKSEDNMIIMFGSEASGLCEELLNQADDKLTLKMSDNVESLNLAVSAGIILYILQ